MRIYPIYILCGFHIESLLFIQPVLLRFTRIKYMYKGINL